MPKNFEEKFKHFCNLKNLEINQNQIDVIKRLQKYYNNNFNLFSKFFFKKSSKKSFYLYGGVGVGKTMILDFFFSEIKEKKKKTSFQ